MQTPTPQLRTIQPNALRVILVDYDNHDLKKASLRVQKVPSCPVFRASILGIAIIVLGRYLIAGGSWT